MSVDRIGFKIKGIDKWFCMSRSKQSNRDISVSLKSYLVRVVTKELSDKLQERSLMGLYNAFYGGHIPVCNFCGKRLCWVDFNVSIFNDGILNLNPIDTKIWKCQDKDCMKERGRLNSNSIEYVSKSYRVSYDDALKIIHERNDSPFYFNPEKQTQEEYSKSQSRNREWYINQFGDDADSKMKHRSELLSYKLSKGGLIDVYGEDEANRICKSRAVTLDSMIAKYGDVEGISRYEHWKKICKQTKDNFISRHGEEIGNKLWEEHLSKLRFNASKERLIELYGSEKADEICQSRYAITLENEIDKHGLVDGTRIYNQWKERCTFGSMSACGSIQSKSAINFFKKLREDLIQNGFERNDLIFCDGDMNEYFVSFASNESLENRVYFLDFYVKSLKVDVEYNGVYWHPREGFTDEQIQKWDQKHKYCYAESLRRDKQRTIDIKSIGIDQIVVWDDANEDDELKKCVEFILKKRSEHEKAK